MSILKEHEKTVLYLNASSVLSPQQLESVIREGKLVEYDYTGCGYFLTMNIQTFLSQGLCATPRS